METAASGSSDACPSGYSCNTGEAVTNKLLLRRKCWYHVPEMQPRGACHAAVEGKLIG